MYYLLKVIYLIDEYLFKCTIQLLISAHNILSPECLYTDEAKKLTINYSTIHKQFSFKTIT